MSWRITQRKTRSPLKFKGETFSYRVYRWWLSRTGVSPCVFLLVEGIHRWPGSSYSLYTSSGLVWTSDFGPRVTDLRSCRYNTGSVKVMCHLRRVTQENFRLLGYIPEWKSLSRVDILWDLGRGTEETKTRSRYFTSITCHNSFPIILNDVHFVNLTWEMEHFIIFHCL